ncbi:MAG: protein-glutamate O-methyltransferase CheR [Bacteroidia bacterium]|nr:protein-glutamate O-methyltransferase CheR [Bacteroidia bacterium]MDW8300996.1 protein-glutamate O-methyltransferase CheR [Bacteroidia bacterium]
MIEDLPESEVKYFAHQVKQNYGYDFENYALSSLKRRLIRILSLYQLTSIEKLLEQIQNKKLDIKEVVCQITVNTTEFFRDPSTWQFIRSQVLPNLIHKPRIDVWHTACSTGEEVLSMIILLSEANVLEKSYFWATDINEKVLEQARKAEYHIRNWDLFMENYNAYQPLYPIEKYCVKHSDKFFFYKSLLKNVVYEKFDLVRDEHNQQYDIVFCRNVLIYFNQKLQNQVVEKLANCTKPRSYLVIGSKETIMWCKAAERYHVLSHKEKVYQLK